MSDNRGIRTSERRSGASLVFNVLLTVLPLLIFNYTRQHYYASAIFYNRGNYLFLLLYGSLLALMMNVYSGYKVRQFRTRELVFSLALATLITNVVIYFVMCLIATRMLPTLAMLVCTLAQWVCGLGIYVLARMGLPLVERAVGVVYILGEGDSPGDMDGKFDKRRTHYVVTAHVDGTVPWEELRQKLRLHSTVLIGNVDPAIREKILDYCFRTGRGALLAPRVGDVLLGSAVPLVMVDTLIYDLNTQGLDMTYRVVKRLFDILISALALVILSPLMLVIAILIKRQDGGPAFFRQTRLTQGGKPFQLIKFRSMVVNAESVTGAVLAQKEDPRITKVGRFIRSTRIDELPQLWNILRGDMSLVGPRPERPEFYETICLECPEFDYRLKVKAGLTGYAQLYGKYNTTFADKVRLDLYYIQHASFLWDLQLLFYTVKIIFVKESTEGVEAAAASPAAEEGEERENV